MTDRRLGTDPLLASMEEMRKSDAAQAARIRRLEDALRKIMDSQASSEAMRQMARDGLRDPNAPPEGNTGKRRVGE